MTTETVDYQAVLADLKLRRARLDQLIAGIEATVMGQGDIAPVTDIDPATLNGGQVSATIHPDSFFGLSIIEASKKYLKMARRAQHANVIGDALAQGGLKRPADNVLSGILVRAAKGREIIKVGKGTWGLSEWYPKAPKEPEERPRGRRGPRKRYANKEAHAKIRAKKAAKKARAAAPQSTEEKAPPREGPPLDVVLEVLRTSGRPMHADEIVDRSRKLGLQVARLPIEGFLGRQVKAGAVQKLGPRVYAIAG